VKDRIISALAEADSSYALQLGRLDFDVLANRFSCDSIALTTTDSSFLLTTGPVSLEGINWIAMFNSEPPKDAFLNTSRVLVAFSESGYELKETPEAAYPQRTEWNVRDADATLVVTHGQPTGGTALTIHLAIQLGKPCRVVDLARSDAPAPIRRWVRLHQVGILNIAGPRESTFPGIGELARFSAPPP
jgi:hypothetical protein